jgi:hypothetical protein
MTPSRCIRRSERALDRYIAAQSRGEEIDATRAFIWFRAWTEAASRQLQRRHERGESHAAK